MDNLDPQAPSQPTLNQAYTTEGNAATHSAQEQRQRDQQTQSSHQPIDRRTASSGTGDGATDSSLGYGVHGAPAGEEAAGRTEEDVGRHNELDGQQMRAPGEGETADVVDRKPGASGSQPSLTSDLDRKKAEQAELRAERKQERAEGVDVAGALGQRGGPANPVD